MQMVWQVGTSLEEGEKEKEEKEKEKEKKEKQPLYAASTSTWNTTNFPFSRREASLEHI